MDEETWLQFNFKDGSSQRWSFDKISAQKILDVLSYHFVHRLEIHGELIDPATIESVWEKAYACKQ